MLKDSATTGIINCLNQWPRSRLHKSKIDYLMIGFEVDSKWRSGFETSRYHRIKVLSLIADCKTNKGTSKISS